MDTLLSCIYDGVYIIFSGVMVQPDQVKMGQGGLCGVTSPGIDSLPLMASSSFTSTSNGIATEVHVSEELIDCVF